jgi:mRNA-degrading endonuclease RelE of RelBE toxin-antitoxin system
MDIVKLYHGKCFTIYCVKVNKRCPIKEFLYNLGERDKRRVTRLLQRVADFGIPKNTEKSRRLKGTQRNIWEFKSYNVRLPYFFIGGNSLVLTHGFFKGAKLKNEIEKAEHNYEQYLRLEEK